MLNEEILLLLERKKEFDKDLDAALGDPNSTAADLFTLFALIRQLTADAESLLAKQRDRMTIH